MDIRLSGVTKIFHPDITALEDVYLEIPKGEFVYLVGPSGSGKTTLMRTITREVKERTGEVLDRVNLWRRRFLYPPQLSGGEQQRVAIARAIVNSPSILLADEPTGNLDLHTAEEIMQLILSINALGATVLMATHNQYLVDAYRQRVVELKMGRVVRDETRGRYEIDGEL